MTTPAAPAADQPVEHEIDIRVRYAECDPQNVAHHSTYVIWLEIARVELLRQRGVTYRDLEANGVLFVVVRMNVRYRKPAFYDDVIRIRVRELTAARHRSGGVKLEHDYHLYRGEELICTAQTTLACVDRNGRLRPVPDGALG